MIARAEGAGGSTRRVEGAGGSAPRVERAGGSKRAYAAWGALAGSVAAYLALELLVLHQPFHVGSRALRFFDLAIYRNGAKAMLAGGSLYGAPMFHGLHFTYPPVAAIAFVPLVLAPRGVADGLSLALNLACLVVLLRLALKLRSRPAGGLGAWPLAALGAAAALWLEPVNVGLGYGQIDLLVATLVVFDLTRPDGARGKGAAIGLAAGLKLTPLIFALYLLLTGRRRAAAVAGGTFAATVAVGFAALPADAWAYWHGTFWQSSRVGFLPDYANQSLWGAIARVSHATAVGPAGIALIAAVGALGLSAAVLARRRGGEAAGFSVCAITGLLVSPIAWTHHWTIAVPALFLLALAAYERRSRAGLLAAAALALLGFSYLPERAGAGSPVHLGAMGLLAADAYVLAGLIVIAVLGAGPRAAPRLESLGSTGAHLLWHPADGT